MDAGIKKGFQEIIEMQLFFQEVKSVRSSILHPKFASALHPQIWDAPKAAQKRGEEWLVYQNWIYRTCVI